MPDINRDQLDSAFTRFSSEFQAGLTNAPAMDFLKIVKIFPSTTTANFYAFLAKTLRMREWLGARIWNDLVNKNFEVKNRKWELSVKLDWDDIQDDTIELYTHIPMEMGQAFPEEQLEVSSSVIIDNKIVFDELPLYDAGHGGDTAYFGTLNNLTTDNLSDGALESADTNASQFKFANQRPTKTIWDTIVVGPALRKRAFDVVKNMLIGNGSGASIENFNAKRSLDVIINPYFTTNSGENFDVDASFWWALFDTSRPLSGIGIQMREDVKFIGTIDEREVMETDEVKYMSRARFEAFGIMPHLTQLNKGSA